MVGIEWLKDAVEEATPMREPQAERVAADGKRAIRARTADMVRSTILCALTTARTRIRMALVYEYSTSTPLYDEYRNILYIVRQYSTTRGTTPGTTTVRVILKDYLLSLPRCSACCCLLVLVRTYGTIHTLKDCIPWLDACPGLHPD